MELTAPSSVIQGNELDVELRLTPDEDLRAREVRVDLVRIEVYYEVSGDHLSRNVQQDTADSEVLWRSEGDPLVESRVLARGIQNRWNASLRVPPDAAPTCKGSLVDLTWKVRAVVDLGRHGDLAEESLLLVLTTGLPASGGGEAPHHRTQIDSHYQQCLLVLELPGETLTGSTVEGELKVTGRHAFSVRGIRAELVASEQAGVRTDKRTLSQEDVSGPTSLVDGETRSYGFSLAVPSAPMPTLAAPNSSLNWYARAVLDRRLRGDLTVENLIQVYSTPPASGVDL